MPLQQTQVTLVQTTDVSTSLQAIPVSVALAKFELAKINTMKAQPLKTVEKGCLEIIKEPLETHGMEVSGASV